MKRTEHDHLDGRSDQAERADHTDHAEYAQFAEMFVELAALDADDPRRALLRDELVTAHLPLATHIAQRFSHRGHPQDDLSQVATVGLINAVDRFDPHRGVDFLSYAVPTIMGEVRRHFRDTGWSMRVPRRLQELHLAVSKATSELSQDLGRAPQPSEIATHLGVKNEEIHEALEAGHAYRSSSLDELLGDAEDLHLGDTVGISDTELDNVENREVIRPMLEKLPKRERTILVLRFFRSMTQTEIAQQIGISQMHVSRILSKTLSTLRDQLQQAGR